MNYLKNILSAPILGRVYFGNTLMDYIFAFIVFTIVVIVSKIFQSIVIHKLRALSKRTKTDIDDTFIEIVDSIRPRFYSFLAFYIAIRMLDVPPLLEKIIEVVLIVLVVYLTINAVQIFINYVVSKRALEDGDEGVKTAAQGVGIIAKIILWSLAFIFVLSNLGVEVTSLIAGLGIGGIALAFAFQNILEDLFSSFAIYFDKPFVVGDFIIVGKHMGTVERIGIKTTRLRALQGEEIIISNRELTSARVQNFKRMDERRVSFDIGVVYDTPQDKIENIPAMIEKIIGSIDNARFDRAHFKSFGDSALIFEVVYYVASADYAQYMDINQNILLEINRVFAQEGISMAYPTQTLYLHKNV